MKHTVSYLPFESWPLDLLIDYILKIHHRGIREKGPQLLNLLETVMNSHTDSRPELKELHHLFVESLQDLEMHLQKEENILFPYLTELFKASEEKRNVTPMHCGSICNPIRVMTMEHDNETQRYQKIKQLTNDFYIPTDACENYRNLMENLKVFILALSEHIYLENEILFPGFINLENKFVR